MMTKPHTGSSVGFQRINGTWTILFIAIAILAYAGGEAQNSTPSGQAASAAPAKKGAGAKAGKKNPGPNAKGGGGAPGNPAAPAAGGGNPPPKSDKTPPSTVKNDNPPKKDTPPADTPDKAKTDTAKIDTPKPAGSTVCRTVKLGEAALATNFEKQLDGAGDVKVKALGDHELLMCGPAANLDVLQSAVQGLSAASVADRPHETHVLRLFYFRQAKDIASAINGSAGLSARVVAVGDDLLVFPSESAADDQAISELKRWVAMMDVPRPQLSISAWSIQLSSNKWEAIQEKSADIRQLVSAFNQELHDALQRGWRYVESRRIDRQQSVQSQGSTGAGKENTSVQKQSFLDAEFTNYLTRRFVWSSDDLPTCPGVQGIECPNCCKNSLPQRTACGEGQYCLGYSRMFSPIQPSLTNLLLALIAATPQPFDPAPTLSPIPAPTPCPAPDSPCSSAFCKKPCSTPACKEQCPTPTQAPVPTPTTSTTIDMFDKLIDNFVDCMEKEQDCSGTHVVTLHSIAESTIVPCTEEDIRQPERAKSCQCSEEDKKKPENTKFCALRDETRKSIQLRDFNLSQRYKDAGKQVRSESIKRPQSPILVDCESQDYNWYVSNEESEQGKRGQPLHPAFSCFRQQLQESLGFSRSRAMMRTALADFLFHYKTTELYPFDFIPWNRGASAQRLDNYFNPLLVEFNRDLSVYLRFLSENVTQRRVHDKKLNSTSEGLVTVRVLSGTQAHVTTTTQSFFPAPTTIAVRDFLSAMKSGSGGGGSSNGGDGGGNSSDNSGSDNKKSSSGGGGGGGGASGIPLLFSSNLTPVAAQSLMALLQGGQSKTAQVGRDLDLKVTANTLSGASSAELEVELNSQEHAEPKLLDQNNNASNNDNIDRVASHNTSTKVRVDSLKLFEVSSFSATLTHGRSVPLVPPFIDLPYIGNLARLRLSPGTVYHRSFAIISAVIVPTAADIANAIEFRSDLEARHLPAAQWLPDAKKKDDKGNAPKPAASSTKVTVEQTGGGSVKLEVGSCPTCAAGRTENQTTGSTTGGENPKPCQAYYWVVTRYHEGISVSAPNLVPEPTDPAAAEAAAQPSGSGSRRVVNQNDKNKDKNKNEAQDTVLYWDAPSNALSFDIYRSQKGDCKPPAGNATNESQKDGKQTCGSGNCYDVCVQLVAPNLHSRSYNLPGPKPCSSCSESACTTSLPEPTIIYSQLPRQPGNLLEFHNNKLRCLEYQTDMEMDGAEECKTLRLQNTPVTRYPAAKE